ncbi:RDD family protein [Candidatus Izimaplasma bacterium HR1]|jgi:hypothetical protein|uniref:RDD family protein n=1 Tax=Candidatus Izimoplasma sp. HR1 TaxID=1541959 RepID=UPI0004F8B676|nr:RDD family protein [Candidatus Izimaplasma bacterium HR1]
MRVGSLRRIGAYLLDLIPIIAILMLLFQFLVGDILKPDNYDNLLVEYNQITADYNELAAGYNTQFDAGELTEEEYDVLYDGLVTGHTTDTEEHAAAIMQYYQMILGYYIISVTLLYYVYSGIMKGHTLGRNMMKIELTGKINWWTLFIREVIWKTGYYMLTLFIGGILVDIVMISFSSKKKAPRDYVSKIDTKFQGVDYPF